MGINVAWIEEQAVNANALKNGRAIYQSGKFIKLYRSADETFYMGECLGSGSKNYITSVDFQDQSHPIFRCNCPSRQFPCKHSIGLLFAIEDKANFEICEIPEDIVKKRERLIKRAQPKDNTEKKPKKVNKTGQKKRWMKQKEGLFVCETMLQDITRMGVAAFVNSQLKDYENIAKQMNDYYLPGIQRLILELVIEAKNALTSDAVYDGVIANMLRLYQIVKKGKQYLDKKINEEEITQDDQIMDELLGHVWNLKELKEAGFYEENQEFIQLGFCSKNEDTLQIGYWYVHPLQEIHKTVNMRPLKVAKYIKEDDSVLEKVRTSCLYLYPGVNNRRMRYDENFTTCDIEAQDYLHIREIAKMDFEQVIKEVKNQLKNPLCDQEIAIILAYEQIKQNQDDFVMVDEFNHQLKLTAMEGTSLHALTTLPSQNLLSKQCALVIFSYNYHTHYLLAKPMSLISNEQIVRLLY
ncbi:SWIM zinc finger family protein [Longibaculum muris]|uniref:SWIM zinc finger family protein n=1 Tax=Longibaculum muris TaxID=1796628 RepID=UPI0022E26BD9|nr:hypothetical protein [Longibaculum muris]